MEIDAIRLLVVDDHPAVRAGLVALLGAEPGLTVVARAADAGEALARLDATAVDVAIVDYHLPGRDGLALCHEIRGRPGGPRVVLYSADADDSLAVLASLAGASAVVRKDSDPQVLAHAIRAAAQGEDDAAVPSPEVLRRLGERLEPEDLPILGMVVHHTPDPEIAETLGVPESRLARRRWSILQRLRGRDGRTRRSDGSLRLPAPRTS